MSILVTGGAGYIGSHTVAELIAHQEDVVVVDNLSKGHAEAVLGAPSYSVDIRDEQGMSSIIRDHDVDTVVHFAADSLVGESMENPLKYYENNVNATAQLLSILVKSGVQNVVFSSTAAVYGEPATTPIEEDFPIMPTNPYGETKSAIERMLYWCHQAYGLNSISLRYFNAAGAHPELPIGEDHTPETHLIPIVLQVALGQRPHVSVFGSDYSTPDGTCIRDYIHVMDLASAHRLAVNRLRSRSVCEQFNLGNGTGYSVNQVIEVARNVTGHPIPAVNCERRAGDPGTLVAAADRAREILGWVPQFQTLEQIISTAWKWHKNHPTGYNDK